MNNNKQINWVSLFANVGIAEFYLKHNWINIVVANELLEKRCKLYKYFYPKTNIVCWDILDDKTYNEILNIAKNNNCKFLLATPPCQWMSIAWQRNYSDPRNSLVLRAIKMIKDLNVDFALIENVPKILSLKINFWWELKLVKDIIKDELEPLWYNVNYSVLDAADYWTPQYRKRAFFLISKNWEWKLPEKQKQITVKEAIWHLPSLESWESSEIPYHYAKIHNNRQILAMKHTPTGCSAHNNKEFYPRREDWTRVRWYETTYKRIDWNKPAPTITMSCWSISSQNNVHPWRKLEDWTFSDARVLTLKELFILMWLPDNINVPNNEERCSDNLIRQVIWEWIPPRLVEAIIKEMPK